MGLSSITSFCCVFRRALYLYRVWSVFVRESVCERGKERMRSREGHSIPVTMVTRWSVLPWDPIWWQWGKREGGREEVGVERRSATDSLLSLSGNLTHFFQLYALPNLSEFGWSNEEVILGNEMHWQLTENDSICLWSPGRLARVANTLQDTLLHRCLFIFHLPCISSSLYHLGAALLSWPLPEFPGATFTKPLDVVSS